MPADRLLNTLLQYYQDVHDDPRSEQIIGTTTHLLTRLGNPLNLGVLTSQLLTAPAIWQRPGFDLSHALRIVSVFNTAALRVRQDAAEALEKRRSGVVAPPMPPGQERDSGGGLKPDEWARAVVRGADDRSRRWQHLLVLTGVLVGFEGNDRRTLSRSLRNTLQRAVVTAANLALKSHAEDGPLAEASIVMALNYAFPLLSEHHQAQLDCDALLPVLVWAMLREGCADGLFLDDIARDVTQTVGGPGGGPGACSWPQHSPSFAALVEMDRRPVMSNMGPLARMAGFAAARARGTDVVLQAHEDLLMFSHRLLGAWARNRLSGVEPALQGAQLSAETLQVTWPALWQVLKKIMFGVVATLQAIVSRSLLDRRMLHDAVAPALAAKSLQILRNISFISSVNGNNSFQAYTFTYLTSLDVICRSGAACEKFLCDFRPNEGIALPSAHLQRTLDLFYLNVAEHLPLSLTTEAADSLIIKPATSYLGFDGATTPTMTEIFESAHSAVLSVLSCPQHSALTIQLAPFYIATLFDSFPRRISPRQFRVAFKTVIQMVSPPFETAAQEPMLGETLLEMLLNYMSAASTAPLAPEPAVEAASEESGGGAQMQSAQSALVLALIDALPFLPLALVEEWLTIAAQALNSIADPGLRRPVRERFWDILVNGEMDVERSAIGVAWWGTKGGREMVLSAGRRPEVPMMSGAIMTEESKL